jgi:hypothetical protein
MDKTCNLLMVTSSHASPHLASPGTSRPLRRWSLQNTRRQLAHSGVHHLAPSAAKSFGYLANLVPGLTLGTASA